MATEVQFVPSLCIKCVLVPGTAYVSVEANQFVPSLTIIFREVAEAFGKVGVLHTGVVEAPLIKTLFAVAVPERIAPALAVE
jgi:hypothetical protein